MDANALVRVSLLGRKKNILPASFASQQRAGVLCNKLLCRMASCEHDERVAEMCIVLSS